MKVTKDSQQRRMYEMEGEEKWKLLKSCKKRRECKINVEAGDE